MAHAAVNWVLNDVDLGNMPPAERWVLIVLADHANRELWQCWPSHKTLADECGVTRRSMLTYLGKLEDRGLIRRTPRYRGDGMRSTDMITLLRGAEFSPPGPETNSTPPVQNAGPKPAKFAQQNQGIEPGKGTIEANASVAAGDEVRQAFERYNRMAEEIGAQIAMALNDDRKRRLKARLKDCGGIEGWYAQMQRIPESPFLTGQTHHHFSLNLDFLLQPSSFTKLVEGQYHDANRSQTDGRPQSASLDRGAAVHHARVEAMVDGAREALDRRRRQRWGVGGSPDHRPEPDPAGGGGAPLAGPGSGGEG